MSEVSLFLDTSSFIQVGLLDKECKWISYELIKNRKGSQVIHSLIHSLLLDNGIKIKDLKRQEKSITELMIWRRFQPGKVYNKAQIKLKIWLKSSQVKEEFPKFCLVIKRTWDS